MCRAPRGAWFCSYEVHWKYVGVNCDRHGISIKECDKLVVGDILRVQRRYGFKVWHVIIAAARLKFCVIAGIHEHHREPARRSTTFLLSTAA